MRSHVLPVGFFPDLGLIVYSSVLLRCLRLESGLILERFVNSVMSSNTTLQLYNRQIYATGFDFW